MSKVPDPVCIPLANGWKTIRRSIVSLMDHNLHLTLPMQRLLSSKAQERKDYWNPSKLCHVGIHWKALAEYSQMSTHVPGLQSFFSFFASFRIGQIYQQQHKNKLLLSSMCNVPDQVCSPDLNGLMTTERSIHPLMDHSIINILHKRRKQTPNDSTVGM